MNGGIMKLAKHVLLSLLFVLVVAQYGLAKEATEADSDLTVELQFNDSGCQIALWVTDADGNYLTELVVSKKTAQKGLGNRRGGLDSKIGGARWSVLPVWAWKHAILDDAGNPYPSKENPLPDAVTCASPKQGTFVINWPDGVKLPEGPCTLWLEINASFDQNEQHDYSWYRGQPSVVYRADIECGGDSAESTFRLVGMGATDGADGTITTDTSSLTSALHLLERGVVHYLP